MKDIVFYKTQVGRCPVEDFLDLLDSKNAQKLAWVMQLVEEIPYPPPQYLKKLINTQDIWEIRTQVGSNIFRVLGFFATEAVFVATNGFQKKSQKVPQKEILLAQRRKQDWYLQLRGEKS